MMNNKNGFTLLELVTVIAIIGILAAVLFPAISSALTLATQMVGGNNLRQIALAYVQTQGRSIRLDYEKDIYKAADWASVLAEKAELNNPSIYCFKEDYLVKQVSGAPPKIIGWARGGEWEMDEYFSNYPLSVTVIVGVQGAPSTTPIAFTRGLDPETGCWKEARGEDGGVYGRRGGYIAFSDGHVEFFENLVDPENQLVHYETGKPTGDIREAVPPGAKAYNWRGLVFER